MSVNIELVQSFSKDINFMVENRPDTPRKRQVELINGNDALLELVNQNVGNAEVITFYGTSISNNRHEIWGFYVCTIPDESGDDSIEHFLAYTQKRLVVLSYKFTDAFHTPFKNLVELPVVTNGDLVQTRKNISILDDFFRYLPPELLSKSFNYELEALITRHRRDS